MTKDEMKEKYGADILEEYEVVNHVFNDPSQLKYCGTIADDIPVWINKEYLKADIRITTGNIVPHFNAGWGAGAKILLPGLAGEETVGRMHVHSGMTTPNSLGIEESPTRKIINAFAEKVGIHLLMNTVLTLKREVIQVFAGHFVKAHQQGVRFAKHIYGVPLSELADITICSSYPATIEFWQGAKGLSASDLATKNGGGIILLTPCPEGLAVMHPRWGDYLHHTHEELKAIYKKGAVEDLIALGIALSVTYVRDRHKICIISDGISDQDAEKIGFQQVKVTDEALNFLSKQYGEKSKINIITHGGETYPTLTK
jgi:nickel-dependent lactate racemase